MPTLDGVPGLSVSIQSNFQALPEYKNNDEEWPLQRYSHLLEGQRSLSYVECETDTEFRIELALNWPFMIDCQSITFKANVDGHPIAQITCTADYYSRVGRYKSYIAARLDRLDANQLSSRPLKFSRIEKVDDQDSSRVKQDAKLVAGLGEIIVSVFRTSQVGYQNFGPSGGLTHKPPTEVAEKALKGKTLSHGVAYGEQSVIPRVAKDTVDTDGPNNPIGVFIMRYRSRDALKSELIIPRSSSPEPVHAQRNGNDGAISREERLANLKKEMASIKAEEGVGELRNNKNKRPADSIPRSNRPSKTSRRHDGGLVIDLTDD